MTIELGGRFKVYVDEQDAHILARHGWYVCDCSRHGTVKLYVRRNYYEMRRTIAGPKRGRRRQEYLHRVIMEPPAGKVVDHINGNGLDCQRDNMRIVTKKVNARHQLHGRAARKGVL